MTWSEKRIRGEGKKGHTMKTRDELEAVNEGYAAAAADGDWDRLATLYTEDGQLMLPNMPVVRGRSDIAALFQGSSPFYIRFETRDIFEDGDLVVDVGTYVNLDAPDGSVSGRGKYVVVYRREGGELKIAIDVASSDAPRAN
jgi:ketosteroid isomerase-like protein